MVYAKYTLVNKTAVGAYEFDYLVADKLKIR